MAERRWRLLWLDGGAALTAGVVVLALHGWLARLYGWVPVMVTMLAVVNLAYATGSLTLAWLARSRPPRRRWIEVLIVANLTWGVMCGALVAVTAPGAPLWGVAHLIFEGCFVVGLAWAEHRYLRPHAAA